MTGSRFSVRPMARKIPGQGTGVGTSSLHMREAGLLLAAAVVMPLTTVVVIGQTKQPVEVREKIDTQDPGYLHFPVWILDQSVYQVLTFDPWRGEVASISFRLTRPGRVRVRLVRRDQPGLVLGTLLDWQALSLGRHELKWDGRDASGNITDNRKVRVVIQGDRDQDDRVQHFRHKAEQCSDLKVMLRSRDQANRAVGDGGGDFGLNADLVGNGTGSGYRLRAFLDWKPWFEKVLPSVAGRFVLPEPSVLAAGDHVVAVNIDDGEDHVGAATLTLVVR